MLRQPGDRVSQAKTWLTRQPGPSCRVCKTAIERGHRYYQEEDGKVVHYCCKQREGRAA